MRTAHHQKAIKILPSTNTQISCQHPKALSLTLLSQISETIQPQCCHATHTPTHSLSTLFPYPLGSEIPCCSSRVSTCTLNHTILIPMQKDPVSTSSFCWCVGWNQDAGWDQSGLYWENWLIPSCIDSPSWKICSGIFMSNIASSLLVSESKHHLNDIQGWGRLQ